MGSFKDSGKRTNEYQEEYSLHTEKTNSKIQWVGWIEGGKTIHR